MSVPTIGGPSGGQKLPDGGGGGGFIGGGGSGNTPSPVNPALLPTSGGLNGFTGLVLLPGIDVNGNMKVMFLDTTNFDTEFDNVVRFRIEESDGSEITIKRIRVKYRNLGSVQVSVSIEGMFSKSGAVTTTLGNPAILNGNRRRIQSIADGRIYNAYFDMVFTDQSPQIVVSRVGGQGPLSIISVAAFGDKHQPQEQ